MHVQSNTPIATPLIKPEDYIVTAILLHETLTSWSTAMLMHGTSTDEGL